MFDDQAGNNQLSRFQSTIKRIGRKPKPDYRFMTPCNIPGRYRFRTHLPHILSHTAEPVGVTSPPEASPA